MTLTALEITQTQISRDSSSGQPKPAAPTAAIRPVAVAPTHNNDGTLREVLRRIEALGIPVIAVNDGSSDGTAQLLAEWAEDAIDNLVCTHARNLGKAAALRTGFVEAARAGFTHAVTIDTDGQLSPEDIPRLLARSAGDPKSLVLGFRDINADDYPFLSRVGRRISNQLVRLECGRSIVDSQCGLRVYPLELVNSIRCRSGHFGFETEIITRAIWADAPIHQMPVQCRYFARDRRISHFKPLRDSMRALGMHARLIAIAANPVRFRSLPRGAAPKRSLPSKFISWLNPITAWRHVRHTEGAREQFSLGFAIGVYIANLPIYGLQSVTALFIARKFRMNPVSLFAGANVGFTPLGPIMIICSIAAGHFVLHGALPNLKDYHFHSGGVHALLVPMLIEWVIGSVIFGAVLAAFSFVVMDLLLRLVPEPKVSEQGE